MSRDYRKSVIPKDDYMATIVHAEYEKEELYLWWVLDTGKYIDHKISQVIPCTDFGDSVLQRMAKRCKWKVRGNVSDMGGVFPIQFIGKRGKISVDIVKEGDFIRNVVTYHQVALSPPEENVMKPKTTSHFYNQQTGRKLPL